MTGSACRQWWAWRRRRETAVRAAAAILAAAWLPRRWPWLRPWRRQPLQLWCGGRARISWHRAERSWPAVPHCCKAVLHMAGTSVSAGLTTARCACQANQASHSSQPFPPTCSCRLGFALLASLATLGLAAFRRALALALTLCRAARQGGAVNPPAYSGTAHHDGQLQLSHRKGDSCPGSIR